MYISCKISQFKHFTTCRMLESNRVIFDMSKASAATTYKIYLRRHYLTNGLRRTLHATMGIAFLRTCDLFLLYLEGLSVPV